MTLRAKHRKKNDSKEGCISGEVTMFCSYSGAPGLAWETGLSFVPTALGYSICHRSSSEDDNSQSHAVTPREDALTWRRIVTDLQDVQGIGLGGDLLSYIQVAGVVAWQAELLKMAWCVFDGPADEQLKFLMTLSDEDIEKLWKIESTLTKPEALNALLLLKEALETDDLTGHALDTIMSCVDAGRIASIEALTYAIADRMRRLESIVDLRDRILAESDDVPDPSWFTSLSLFKVMIDEADLGTSTASELFSATIEWSKLNEIEACGRALLPLSVTNRAHSVSLSTDELLALSRGYPPPTSAYIAAQLLDHYMQAINKPGREFLEWCIVHTGRDALEALRVIDAKKAATFLSHVHGGLDEALRDLRKAEADVKNYGAGMGGVWGYQRKRSLVDEESANVHTWEELLKIFWR
jgi:hypothetical protein